MTKIYEYEGAKFEISKPEKCQISVTGLGLIGDITIHTATGKFRESLDGWGTDQSTLEAALENCCRRIIKKSKESSKEDKCKEMDTFYDSLK